MNDKNLYLGVDTSNYTTSVAVVDDKDQILQDKRIPLTVMDGELGLRQSSALYQHWENLPLLLEPILKEYSLRLKSICASEKPRPQKDSYMPVFKAGTSAAKLVADSLGISLLNTTHQEGHFKAGAHGTAIDFEKQLIAAHLSGGTLELLALDKNRFDIIGGTKDISYGQLIDRIGVLLGFCFPAGKQLDALAQSCSLTGIKNPLSAVFCKGTWLNLSGLETQLRKMVGNYPKDQIAAFIFERIADSFISIVESAKTEYPVNQILVTGGIAASNYLRKKWTAQGYIVGKPELCSDNAVGVALMKGHILCH